MELFCLGVCMTEDWRTDRRTNSRVDRHDRTTCGRAVHGVAWTCPPAAAALQDSDARHAGTTTQGPSAQARTVNVAGTYLKLWNYSGPANLLHVIRETTCRSCSFLINFFMPWSYMFFYPFFFHFLYQNVCGTEWPFMCWCAVKKVLAHSCLNYIVTNFAELCNVISNILCRFKLVFRSL